MFIILDRIFKNLTNFKLQNFLSNDYAQYSQFNDIIQTRLNILFIIIKIKIHNYEMRSSVCEFLFTLFSYFHS